MAKPSKDAVDLAAATYAVLVTDAHGCTVTETFYRDSTPGIGCQFPGR